MPIRQASVSAAAVDFTLFDNGSAVATLTPKDKAGLDTAWPADASIPTGVSSDPGLVVAMAADGLSAIVTPSVPPVKLTGATITFTGTLADGTVITGTSDPIDVVATGPSTFGISLK
jgi:hypothetical protein